MNREIVCDWEIAEEVASTEKEQEKRAACLCGAHCLCAETLERQEREIQEVQRQREMEVMVEEVRRETPDTTTLFFFAGNDHLVYAGGQFITIDPHQFTELERFVAFLENVKGKKEKPRAYSLTSAPHEERLAITVKEERYVPGRTAYPPLLSPFLVHQVRKGTRLRIRGFTGAYTLPRDLPAHTEILHVCAGSGVVPSFSLIKESLWRGDPQHHLLLYSSKRRQDILYYEEFERLHQRHPDRFEVVHGITREEPEGIRSYQRGRISRQRLRNVISHPDQILAFVCGSGITPHERRAARETGVDPEPRFVEHMVALLLEMGVEKKRIKQESWG